MEKEFKLSWLKVIGVIALIAMIIVVIFLVYHKKKSNGDNSSAAFINNINLMKDVAYDYFKGDNLPDKIGEAYKITLEEMITNNMIVEFVDDKGNTCNKVDSYVQVTKSLENEYTMKVFLSCDDKSDYVLSSFYVNDEVENNKNEKEEEKVEENNKVSDNKVNNNSSSTQGSSNNYKPNNNVTYVTNYNINYVNNCKNCVGSSCLNSCVNNVYYTVSFDADGGTNVDKQTVKHGETAVYKNTTREGYDLLGWYLDGNKYDFSKPVTKKITLSGKK